MVPSLKANLFQLIHYFKSGTENSHWELNTGITSDEGATRSSNRYIYHLNYAIAHPGIVLVEKLSHPNRMWSIFLHIVIVPVE